MSIKKEKIFLDNTDGAGFIKSLNYPHGFNLHKKNLLIIGAGGAAKGIIGPILDVHPARITISNRSLEKIKILRERFNSPLLSFNLLNDLNSDSILKDYENTGPFDIIVNATSSSVSMEDSLINPKYFRNVQLIVDLFYAKNLTSFLRVAKEYGCIHVMDGFPMLEAAAGGGGRGMKVVSKEEDLLKDIQITRSEAKLAFGNAEVYLEKFLQNPRHIEIQILADMHGNCIHLGERDCSLQRRHQKVIEETPASVIGPEEREKIGKICTTACKQLGYAGAGTIEFLFENGKFYFIEMNTRIQVEHGVTEAVTGIDLVREQILIASGKKLEISQDDVLLSGHAIQCRINAEDPKSFIPSPGKITNWHAPGGFGVRVDSHVYVNYTVPPNYDSLIGKIIVYGNNREQAIYKMQVALSETIVEGIHTNISLHRELMRDENFISGDFSINYLENKFK
mgnify:CR=1 FL=1